MVYKITKYSYDQAKRLNVQIKPSTNPKKKIDVFKDGEKIASIGAMGYGDYPTYLLQDKELAEQKRRNYKKRHQANRKMKGTNGYYADQILW